MIDYQKVVKELRDKLIMTQIEFANFLCVAYQSVNRWENGICKPTTKIKRKIIELCKANDVEIKEVDEWWNIIV